MNIGDSLCILCTKIADTDQYLLKFFENITVVRFLKSRCTYIKKSVFQSYFSDTEAVEACICLLHVMKMMMMMMMMMTRTNGLHRLDTARYCGWRCSAKTLSMRSGDK